MGFQDYLYLCLYACLYKLYIFPYIYMYIVANSYVLYDSRILIEALLEALGDLGQRTRSCRPAAWSPNCIPGSVFLWSLVMGSFDSGCLVYSWYIFGSRFGVAHRKNLGIRAGAYPEGPVIAPRFVKLVTSFFQRFFCDSRETIQALPMSCRALCFLMDLQ